MASNVSVELELEPYKKVSIKTTPSMSLKSIVSSACENFKLKNIDLYQLKYRREFLDLSLSVRFANLPPGAKLVLVQGRSKSAAPSQVSIALQLDEGGRLMGKFSSDTVLWEILKFFESTNSSLNLTTRSEIPTQKNNTLFKKFTESGKKKFYQMPVCVFMNKEYNTIPILKQTSLRDAGLTSGNGVIRVLLKCTDKTLEEILSEIETVSKGDDTSTATEIFVKPDRVSSLVELNENSSANPDVSKNFSNSEVSEEDPTRKQNIEIPNSLGNTEVAIDDADKVTSMDVDSVSITTDNPSNVPKMMETGDGVSNNKSLESSKSIDKPNYLEKFKEVEDTPMDITNPEKDSNENLLPFDREIKVYKALPANVKAAKVNLPDSFFELSPAELKFVYMSTKIKNEDKQNQILKTKAMREKEVETKSKKYPKTLIRVKFPDQTMLEARFLSGEQFITLIDVVKAALKNPSNHVTKIFMERNFTLYLTPPFKNLSCEGNKTFWNLGLAPASLIYIKFDEDDLEKIYFNDEYLSKMIDHPTLANILSGEEEVEENEEIDETRSRTESSSSIEKKNENNTSTYSNDKSEKKLPRWFKFGKK